MQQHQAGAVPYQAYRSKRHSRTVSTLPIPPNVPPPTVVQWDAEKDQLVLDIDPPSSESPSPPPPDTPPPSSSSVPPKKASTFRRLHPRPSTLQAQSRVASVSSRQFDLSPSPPVHSRVPSINSDDKPLPNRPNTPSSSSPVLIQPSSPSTSLPPPPASVLPTPSLSPFASPPSSTSPLPSGSSRSPAPYRPGFQPRGVLRPRTDEFSPARKAKHDATRIERTKLERRLEKLIQLHFPMPNTEPNETKKLPIERRKSNLFDLDLAGLKNIDPSDVWKSVLQSHALQGAKADIRAAEQRIAPWQEDATVSKCPLCTASFHPLTNRKHHCRLCGKIICSLPIKHPQRSEPCSILFIVDLKTRRIEEVGEGVDYGVKKRANGMGTGSGTSNEKDKGETLADDEKFLKGVRVCRDCKSVLLREQFYQQVSRTPPLSRLYEAFISLEKEIEEALPQFQDLLQSLDSDYSPSKEAAIARKRILDDFASYDAISKRIRKIPCTPGSSQDRVQLAIRTRADLFLQKNMFPLQSFPKGKKQGPSSDATTPLVDADALLAHALQPLLEQEALLESFVGEAMAHRKFEDARTLKANLKEIRVEIDRMLQNQAEDGSTVAGAGAGAE